jgi:1-acyl-sn-glycerol-3-phosphate acyltransferase
MLEQPHEHATRGGSMNPPSPFALLERARAAVRDAADETVDRWLGDEVRDRLARAGGSSDGPDEFGFDPRVARYAVLVARRLYRSYFRAEVSGLEHIPEGRVMFIANHSGQLPLDGLAIGASLLLDAPRPRFIRSMVEKWTATLPFVAELFPRCGQIVGVPENCIRLLERDEAVLVFPEGARGISKPFDQRYRLTEFGLGFMRMALAARAPIVPVAVIGAEEQYVSIANLERLGRVFGMPALPVMPQLLLPGGFLPLPTKYRLYFGPPMRFEGDPDDEDAAIEAHVAVVRGTVQSMVNRGLKERRSIFW